MNSVGVVYESWDTSVWSTINSQNYSWNATLASDKHVSKKNNLIKKYTSTDLLHNITFPSPATCNPCTAFLEDDTTTEKKSTTHHNSVEWQKPIQEKLLRYEVIKEQEVLEEKERKLTQYANIFLMVRWYVIRLCEVKAAKWEHITHEFIKNTIFEQVKKQNIELSDEEIREWILKHEDRNMLDITRIQTISESVLREKQDREKIELKTTLIKIAVITMRVIQELYSMGKKKISQKMLRDAALPKYKEEHLSIDVKFWRAWFKKHIKKNKQGKLYYVQSPKAIAEQLERTEKNNAIKESHKNILKDLKESQWYEITAIKKWFETTKNATSKWLHITKNAISHTSTRVKKTAKKAYEILTDSEERKEFLDEVVEWAKDVAEDSIETIKKNWWKAINTLSNPETYKKIAKKTPEALEQTLMHDPQLHIAYQSLKNWIASNSHRTNIFIKKWKNHIVQRIQKRKLFIKNS